MGIKEGQDGKTSTKILNNNDQIPILEDVSANSKNTTNCNDSSSISSHDKESNVKNVT